MIQIRDYTASVSFVVGKLIADTCSAYYLNFADSDQMIRLLGPFALAYSIDKEHQDAIAQAIRSELVYLAQIDNENILNTG